MISLKGRRIALIGGAGFIGHHLALALHRMGAQVHIIDSLHVNNLLSFASYNEEPGNALYYRIVNERLDVLRASGIPIEIQDARDYHAISRLLGIIQPQVIIHLAAVAHAGRSNKDPHSTFDHSFRTLENALDNARGRVEQFVYFSSSMIYGNFKSDTVDEDTLCEPIGIYGALKFSGEKMIIAYNQVFGLPYTIVRPSALYGPRCVSRRVGQVFIENALQNSDIYIDGDGSDFLDFTYIEDLVSGIINVLENENSRNQIFNLTYGNARSISDMAEIIGLEFPGVSVKYKPRNRLMPKRGTLCIDKAKRLIGYKPIYPLERGLKEYMEWYKSLAGMPFKIAGSVSKKEIKSMAGEKQ